MTNEFITNCINEVATPHIVSHHSHIAHLAKNFAPFDKQAEVLLLLGRDCSAAMATKCFGYRAPYAHCTPVGWTLVGTTCLSGKETSQTNTVLKVQDSSSFENICLSPTFPKKEFVQKVTANPFVKSPVDEMFGLFKDDTLFMQKVVSNIRINEEGNITMPLPFRKNNPQFHCNKSPVYYRMVNTLNKIHSKISK